MTKFKKLSIFCLFIILLNCSVLLLAYKSLSAREMSASSFREVRGAEVTMVDLESGRNVTLPDNFPPNLSFQIITYTDKDSDPSHYDRVIRWIPALRKITVESYYNKDGNYGKRYFSSTTTVCTSRVDRGSPK